MTGRGEALRGTVPREGLARGEEADAWTVGGSKPDTVVFPRTLEELAGVMKRATEEGLRVVPAGRASSLDGAGPRFARESGSLVVVSAARLDRILHYEPADLVISAQAGIGLDALGSAVGEEGQWLPLDPPGARKGGSLGGLLAAGLAGPLEAGYGAARDQVLGLVLVTGDGRVLEVGGRVVKNVAGYDLTRLAVGSRGSLGVVASATVRLHPAPAADRTLVYRAERAEELLSRARRLATAPVLPAALELMEAGSGSGAALGARVLGSPEAVEASLELLEEAAGSPGERLEGDGSRSLFAEAAGWEGGAALLLLLSHLPSGLERLVAEARTLAAPAGEPGARGAFSASVTRGRLRLALPVPRPGPARERFVGALEASRAGLREAGGSLAIIRAPRELRSAVRARGRSSERVGRIEEELKAVFDPGSVLPLVDL